MSAETPAEALVWQRLLGSRATFGVSSWREASLDTVRVEVEEALGVRFDPSEDKVYDGELAYECAMPACELRLNCWPARAADLFVFNFIGVPREHPDAAPPDEDIGEALAMHLRSRGYDWYVPDRLELLEGGGVLGERGLDRDVIVTILAARWLAFCAPEKRDAGVQSLDRIVERWLTAARRARDPIAELMRMRRKLEARGKDVDPERRADLLVAYAVEKQW